MSGCWARETAECAERLRRWVMPLCDDRGLIDDPEWIAELRARSHDLETLLARLRAYERDPGGQ